MNLFERICSDIREDVKKANNRDILSIEEETLRFITVFDYMDEVDRFYTINNPKYMDRKFLQDKLVITNSVKRSRKYHIDTTKMLDWLYKNLPKEMWMTLNKIVIINKDEDFDELYQKEDFSDLLETHELPDDDNDLLGITWFSEDIVVISLKNIINQTMIMEKDGYIYDYEVKDCINYGILTTLTHEIRHVAQHNYYLPEEILNQQVDDDEDDAESFAREFCNEHPVFILN